MTPLAKQTRSEREQIQGKPLRFVNGHNARLPRSRAHIENQARSHRGAIHPNRDERSPFWKGDEAGYDAIHKWLNARYPRTGVCERCEATGKRTEYAFTRHGEPYTRDRDHYRELCTSCHKWVDGYVAEKGWHDNGRFAFSSGRLSP